MAVGDGDRVRSAAARISRIRSAKGPFSGAAQRRWRTPSSSVTSMSAGVAAMAFIALSDAPRPSMYSPTTGLVFRPVARISL